MACLGTPVVSIVHHPCPLHLQQILLPCRSNTVIQDTVKEDTFEAGTGYIKHIQHIHIIYIYRVIKCMVKSPEKSTFQR